MSITNIVGQELFTSNDKVKRLQFAGYFGLALNRGPGGMWIYLSGRVILVALELASLQH